MLLYFGDYSVTNYTDVEISNRFYTATRWHQTNGIPIAKIAVHMWDKSIRKHSPI